MICNMQEKGMLSYPVCLGAKCSVHPTRHPDFIHWNLISIQIKHLNSQLLSMFHSTFELQPGKAKPIQNHTQNVNVAFGNLKLLKFQIP